jgi:hypothetical protein
LRQHADDRERLAVDAEVSADRVLLPGEPLLPRRVRQDRLPGVPEFTVGLGEEPPADRLHLQKPQQRRGARHREDALGFGVAAQRDATRIVKRLLLEHVGLFEAVVVVGDACGAAGDACSRIGVVHMDQLSGISNRQRLQQDGVHDRKNRRIGPDAHRQGRDRSGGEPAIFP